MKTTTYNVMEYHELDDLINSYFPKSDFNVVADEELNNDTDKDFGQISKNDWNKSIDQEEFFQIILGKKPPTYCTYMFLAFFVYEEILPEGNYLVNVSW